MQFHWYFAFTFKEVVFELNIDNDIRGQGFLSPWWPFYTKLSPLLFSYNKSKGISYHYCLWPKVLANLRTENLGERKDPLQLLLFSNIYEVNNALANWYANDRDRTILCMLIYFLSRNCLLFSWIKVSRLMVVFRSAFWWNTTLKTICHNRHCYCCT